jgi:hypothetical protein
MQYTKLHRDFKAILVDVDFGVALRNVIMFCILHIFLTGHAPVRGHLHTMGLFDGDPTCRFCRKETETV